MPKLKVLLALALSTALCCAAAAVQADSQKQTVERWYDAFDKNAPQQLEQILSVDWQDIPAGKDQAPGPAGAKEVLEHLHQAFSDFHIRIEEVLQDGNKVIVRSRISGIHSGAFAGLAPTHRRIDIRATDIHELKDGKIIRTWKTG